MNLGSVSIQLIQSCLRNEGLLLRVGPMLARLRSNVPALPGMLQQVYGEFPWIGHAQFIDFDVALLRSAGWRRYVHPQVEFWVDRERPFEPFPLDTPLPLLEWGLNWCVGRTCNNLLLLHAGVVARDTHALILPALPGSGKSTLTAAFTLRGWRLLSDEFGAIRLKDCSVLPMPRPIALKNASIEAIRAFAPEAVIGPSFPKTRKGTVAHLAPDRHGVDGIDLPASPRLILFPSYRAGGDIVIEPIGKSRAMLKLAANSFNYELLGPSGFLALKRIVESTPCFRLGFGRLDDAIAAAAELFDNPEAFLAARRDCVACLPD